MKTTSLFKRITEDLGVTYILGPAKFFHTTCPSGDLSLISQVESTKWKCSGCETTEFHDFIKLLRSSGS